VRGSHPNANACGKCVLPRGTPGAPLPRWLYHNRWEISDRVHRERSTGDIDQEQVRVGTMTTSIPGHYHARDVSSYIYYRWLHPTDENV